MRRPQRRRAPPRVDLKVDALHLHGFSSAERGVLLAALEGELSRIIAERGLPGTAPLRLDHVRIDCAPARHPGDAGREAARILYAQLCLANRAGAGS
ncbi:hypothetical protein WMF04_23930 [Sorangium sp. So ce260]|uniref:hypothetical protein n=1 Tax=Sorangium sp. So ce260 TaxID=3133291 RepID=UPI003F5D6133